MLKLHHIDIWINNVDESIIFYQCLGFVKIKEINNEEENKKIILMKLDNFILEMKYHYKGQCVHNDFKCKDNKVFGLSTKDINKIKKHIEDENLTREKIIIQKGILGQSYFIIHDPNGISIEFIEEK